MCHFREKLQIGIAILQEEMYNKEQGTIVLQFYLKKEKHHVPHPKKATVESNGNADED